MRELTKKGQWPHLSGCFDLFWLGKNKNSVKLIQCFSVLKSGNYDICGLLLLLWMQSEQNIKSGRKTWKK